MIALLALLALAAGPVLVWAAGRRLARRAAATGAPRDRGGLRALAAHGAEARVGAAGLLLTVLALVVLMVMAVLG